MPISDMQIKIMANMIWISLDTLNVFHQFDSFVANGNTEVQAATIVYSANLRYDCSPTVINILSEQCP